jgi:hypothetical protein
MLADRNETAIEFGLEAIDLAEQLGLDDLRANALNNVGSARANAGDRAGFADLEESIRLASQLNSISDVIRGHNNLAVVHFVHGEVERAQLIWEQTRRLAEQFGHLGFARFVDGGPAIANRYLLGEWDEAFARANAFLAQIKGGAPNYHAAASHIFRGLIRLGRADPAGAESDAERAIELARPIGDPQLLQPTLARGAVIFLATGSERRAKEILDEALEGLRELRQLGFAAVELHNLAWVAVMVGREGDVLTVTNREAFASPWLEAARSVVAADFRHAADILGGIGIVTQEAFFRLRAAEQLVGEGRRAEADEQLRPALAFYRSVGATRYVREGEALLAASA